MTEETAQVTRLDYSRPPPGYTATPGMWSHPHSTESRCAADSLGAAWDHFKDHNDPPGLEVRWLRGQRDRARYGVFLRGQYASVLAETKTPMAARAAAWGWYDRRLALEARLCPDAVDAADGIELTLAPWPAILAWSDAQVAEVERWLSDSTAELPKVLRPRFPKIRKLLEAKEARLARTLDQASMERDRAALAEKRLVSALQLFGDAIVGLIVRHRDREVHLAFSDHWTAYVELEEAGSSEPKFIARDMPDTGDVLADITSALDACADAADAEEDGSCTS